MVRSFMSTSSSHSLRYRRRCFCGQGTVPGRCRFLHQSRGRHAPQRTQRPIRRLKSRPRLRHRRNRPSPRRKRVREIPHCAGPPVRVRLRPDDQEAADPYRLFTRRAFAVLRGRCKQIAVVAIPIACKEFQRVTGLFFGQKLAKPGMGGLNLVAGGPSVVGEIIAAAEG